MVPEYAEIFSTVLLSLDDGPCLHLLAAFCQAFMKITLELLHVNHVLSSYVGSPFRS